MAKAKLIDFFAAGLEDTNGDPLASYQVRTYATDGSTAKVVWEDRDKTLPTSAGKSSFSLDTTGRAVVYGDGLYTIKIWTDTADPDVDSPYKTYSGVEARSTTAFTDTALGLSALQAIDGSAGEYIYLAYRTTAGDGGHGYFRWDASNLSTEVSADEVTTSEGNGGIYIAPASDKTGASGAWIRLYNDERSVSWYGADLSSAVSAAGSTETTLLIDTDVVLTDSQTVTAPATMQLKVLRSGSIDGTSGGGTETLTINGSLQAGRYQIFGSNITVNGSPTIDAIYPEWWGSTDIGASINSALSLVDSEGGRITLAPGTYTCSTTIDLDNISSLAGVIIEGSGMVAGSSPASGTVIDGSAMASNVISGALTKDNYHIRLEKFTVLAGSAGGIVIGDQENGYSAAHSFMENITVKGGAPGINLEFWTNGWVNHIYSVAATGNGILLDTMNACRFGIVTVRQAAGSWALTIEKGLGTNYGTLYLESNEKSALRLGDDIRGSRIEQIYTENNNTDNTQAYEILIADQTMAAEDTEAVEIGSMFLSTPANAYTTAQLAVEHGTGLILGPLWGTSDPLFSTVGSNVQNITFKGWSIPSTESIDISNCATFSKFTFIGCNINPTGITWPTVAAQVDIIGSNRLLHNEQSVYISDGSDYQISPWETHVVVDTDTQAQTTTLPFSSVAAGKVYYIVNEGTSTNDITVQPRGAETIMGSASVAISDFAMAAFKFEPTRGRWMVVSRGTKS